MDASPSIVIIGIHDDTYLDRNARRLHDQCLRNGIPAVRVDYCDIDKIAKHMAADMVPASRSGDVIAMLFFPHRFWDANCETPADTDLYGTSVQAYERFRDFFHEVEERLNRALAGRRIVYPIPPCRAFVDRDKVETVRILAAAGVRTTTPMHSRVPSDLLDCIEPGRGIFVKCRFGAEGKGITYLSREGWWTNYRVDGDRLGNWGIHDRWPFTEITGQISVLAELLRNEMIVEQEIVTAEIEPNAKWDLRVYTSAGAAPHMFLRINRRDAFITNFSQGARIEHQYAGRLTDDAIENARSTALAAAKALEVPFAGVDLMVDRDHGLAVVEAQVFTDFPDPRFFNLPAFLVDQIKSGVLSTLMSADG